MMSKKLYSERLDSLRNNVIGVDCNVRNLLSCSVNLVICRNTITFCQVVDPDVRPQDRTLHILARYISKECKTNDNLENIRKIHLSKFLENHESWCEQVAYNYLQVKNKSWQQFKDEWLHDAFALNMVGIFIWARAYHKHVAVFFGYNYWSSHIDHDLNKVNIFLLYRGNNRFDETCMIGGMEYQQRYNEFARKARKIDRYFAKQRAEKEKKEK